MNLTPQHKRILELHSDTGWHCSTEIEYIRDQRKRISELNAGGYIFESKPCIGICGKHHNARLLMRRLEQKPVKVMRKIILENGVPVIREVRV